MLQVRIEGHGVPLLWGHGLMASMAQEDATGWFRHPAHKLKWIRYDACGHGLSHRPLDPLRYRWPALAADMLMVARQHSLDRFALGGHSMGCATAVIAALQAPDRVSKLVLATPPTAWSTRAEQIERYRQMIRLLKARGLDTLLRLSRHSPALPGWLTQARPEDAARQLETLSGFSRARLIAILQGAIASDMPAQDELKKLTQPTLILAWRDDPLHPLSSAEQLADRLPNATLQIISDAHALAEWPQHIANFVRD